MIEASTARDTPESDQSVSLPAARESDLFALLSQHGPMSRRDVHRHTGWRPNTVGLIADGMIRRGLLREGEAVSSGPGRPARPLEIDPTQRLVMGLMLGSQQVSSSLLNLHGAQVGATRVRDVAGDSAVTEATDLLGEVDLSRVVALGVSVPGLFDESSRRLLLSWINPDGAPVSLQPLFDAAEDVPILLGNCAQNLAVRWALRTEGGTSGLVLLIHLRDGTLGASALLDGRPIHGCVRSDLNLGHSRLGVETEPCYCGQSGCVERIFSTAFYQAQPGAVDGHSLLDAIGQYHGDDPALERVTDLLAMALGNTISQLGPHHFVIASDFNQATPYINHLIDRVRSQTMPVLANRFRVHLWDVPVVDFAQAGAALALGSLHGLAGDDRGLTAGVE
jgi:predicted NBD/HSP70 family sugar kinase